MGSRSDQEVVRRLSAAPWPAYVRARVRTGNLLDEAVFGLPRKCASNTMKLYLEQVADSCSYVDRLDAAAARTYVAVVRHPVTRLVAVWRHAVVKNRGQYIKLPADMTWEDFVDHVCNTNDSASNYHWRQYSDELLAFTGRRPTHVLRCERLQYHLNWFCREMNWPVKPLSRLNATGGPEVIITDQMLARLRVRYAQDFENFGYSVAS